MSGVRQYSEEDRARVFVVLTSNDGNVKRTARETNMDPSTVRRWRDEWLETPPTIEEIEAASEDFLEKAERVRNLALHHLENKLPHANASQLSTVVGILDDKVTRAKGLATSRVEHVRELPPPEMLRAAMVDLVREAVSAASLRQDEIVDAEFAELEEQAHRRALPAPK